MTPAEWLGLAICVAILAAVAYVTDTEHVEGRTDEAWIAAHTEGFRGSAAYDRWRHLLHRFYEPFPVVEHFTEVR